MSFLSRLLEKLRRRKPKQPETPPVVTPPVVPGPAPVVPPVVVAPPVVTPPPFAPGETPEAFYLRMNPDVAQHNYFGQHPKQHWDEWGWKEGRQSKWPAPSQPTQRGFFKPDEVEYTLTPPTPPAGMVYPAVGVWIPEGTTSPVPVFSLKAIPANTWTPKWGANDPYPKIVRVAGVNILAKADRK